MSGVRRRLALDLLVLRIRLADHPHLALATNHLAVLAHTSYRCANLHGVAPAQKTVPPAHPPASTGGQQGKGSIPASSAPAHSLGYPAFRAGWVHSVRFPAGRPSDRFDAGSWTPRPEAGRRSGSIVHDAVGHRPTVAGSTRPRPHGHPAKNAAMKSARSSGSMNPSPFTSPRAHDGLAK